MSSLLQKNKIYNLTLSNNYLLGNVGESLTRESVKSLAGSLFSYGFQNQIDRYVLGYGDSLWSKLFINILSDELNTLGLLVDIPDKPCTIAELSWLVSENKKSKKLSIYISTHVGLVSELKISFLNENGHYLSSKEFKKLLKHQSDVISSSLNQDNIQYKNILDLSKYSCYLKDKSLIESKFTKSVVNIDCMFSSTEYLLDTASKELSLPFRFFNRESEPLRLNYYKSNPTGRFLKWYASYPGLTNEQFLFAFNGSGERVGLYDIKQNVELSKDSLSLLFLNKFKDSNKTVVISNLINSNVVKLAKKWKFRVIISDKQLQDFPDPIDLYIDGLGSFYINGICNPILFIEAILSNCNFNSPGEIIDLFSSKKSLLVESLIVYKDKNFFNLLILQIKEKLDPNYKLNKSFDVSILKNKKDRIVFKYDNLEQIGIVKIETNTDTRLKELLNYVREDIIELL